MRDEEARVDGAPWQAAIGPKERGPGGVALGLLVDESLENSLIF